MVDRFVATWLAVFALASGVAAAPAPALAQGTPAARPAVAAVPNVFLIQNSGWMEPFYTDPSSEFKPLVKGLIQTVSSADAENFVLAFNQSVGENRSPRLLARAAGFKSEIGQAVDGLTVARKPNSPALADTDFLEALTTVMQDQLGGKSGIVWLITNNRNSPNNSPETAKRNREFYELLHGQESVRRILAYPLRMRVVGKVMQGGKPYSAGGLMIYGIAVGQAADEKLKRLSVDKQSLAGLFTDLPARIKPLNQEALTFVPGSIRESAGVSASLASDKKTIILEFDAGNRPGQAQLVGRFRNEFFPYRIDSANVEIGQTFPGNAPIKVSIQPDRIGNLAAGAITGDHTLRISVPPVPSMFNPEVVFSAGYQVRGVLQIRSTEQQLSLSPAFPARMNELFPGDPLPDLFAPSAQSRQSSTEIPIVIRVTYPIWPLAVVAGGGLAALLALLGFIFVLRRESRYRVVINGVPRTVAMRPFGSQPVRSESGDQVATLKRGLGRPRAVGVKEGASVIVK